MTTRILIFAIFVTCAKSDFINGGLRIVKKVLDQCDEKSDFGKCLKIQALRIADRALQLDSFTVIEGFKIVSENRTARSLPPKLPLSDEKLNQLPSSQIDDLIALTTTKFIDTHSVQVNIPKLVEEGRKKKDKGYTGPFLAALAIKATFMAMAYKTIGIMAGTALIIGKMALILSVILGLKKLISSNEEKTTFEIVKQPERSHVHTSSFEDEGHYHRSLTSGEDMMMQDKAYRGYFNPNSRGLR